MDARTTTQLRDEVAGIKTEVEPPDDFIPSTTAATPPPSAPTAGADPVASKPGTEDVHTKPLPYEAEVTEPTYPDRTTSGGDAETGTADFGGEPDDGAVAHEPPPPPPARPGYTGYGSSTGSYTSTGGGTKGTVGPMGDVSGKDLKVAEKPGSEWEGNKPEFLVNTPENMPKMTAWNVTEEQTVQGQMASLLKDDNPVFKSIREATLRAHAAQGGKNSLMAARSATMQMANMAFQIGSADAATLARSAEFNAAMANQFGLAEQQFMHNAMLSDQNYRQGMMIQRTQIAGQLMVAETQIAGQLAAIDAQGAINMQLQDQQNEHVLGQLDRSHGHKLEEQELDFQHNWTLEEQLQGHKLEAFDRETENLMRADDNRFNQNFALQYLAETSADGRQLIDSLGQVRSNPNISGAQATAATADIVHNYNQLRLARDALFANPVPGTAMGGGAAGGGTATAGKVAGYTTPAYNYTRYSLGYGGYSMVPPPVARFWGGTGVAAQPLYGSNPNYGATGQTSGQGGNAQAPLPPAPPPPAPTPTPTPPPTGGGGGAAPPPGAPPPPVPTDPKAGTAPPGG